MGREGIERDGNNYLGDEGRDQMLGPELAHENGHGVGCPGAVPDQHVRHRHLCYLHLSTLLGIILLPILNSQNISKSVAMLPIQASQKFFSRATMTSPLLLLNP